ncbi:RHS repeat-associated core domain-containing protein [Pseudomonas sp. Sample_24]|uniref:RHS repeat-associated core domain-containing protein n=1 Tax=Pseudomonas sp. Sample_24 TaxID=2448268 RepID=UPI001032B49D|nr:RHS repeat-associated core domain-containing protein [Pseudomonas sp. Sample_24]
MPSQNKEVLCTYHYDPLDCLIGLNSATQDTLQRFYCKRRLVTEIHGLARCSILQQDDLLLAQRISLGDTLETALLATDQQRSVMHTVGGNSPAIAYSPYGHRHADNSLTSLLGFNGERPDAITRHYLLGNGYRAFNPIMMRFNSPDSLSPFGKGGINPYAYCSGDPVNGSDPTGHMRWFLMSTIDFVDVLRDAKLADMSAFSAGHKFSYLKHSNNLNNPLSNSNAQLAKWRAPARFSNERSVNLHSALDKDPLNMDLIKKFSRIEPIRTSPFSNIFSGKYLNPKINNFFEHRDKYRGVLDQLERVASFGNGNSITPRLSRAHAKFSVAAVQTELVSSGNIRGATEVSTAATYRFAQKLKKIREDVN